jgi:hypothetical protein
MQEAANEKMKHWRMFFTKLRDGCDGLAVSGCQEASI